MNEELKRLIIKYYICMGFPQHEIRYSIRIHRVCLRQKLSSFLLHATLNSKSPWYQEAFFLHTERCVSMLVTVRPF